MLATIYTKTVKERTWGVLIGAASVVIMTIFAVWVYADLDDVIAEFADAFPEAFVSALGITTDGGATSIVLGEMMNLIGPLVLGGIAISIGTSAIAGEERDGTIGILLANPRSRTAVLTSKTRAMLTAVVAGSLLIWAGAALAVSLSNTSSAGLFLGPMMIHAATISIFFGVLALFLGSWTGNAALSSGASVGAMIFSFLGAGLLPLVEGWENGAKIFPWYYFNSSQPLQNGLDAGHLAVLWVAIVILFGLAVVGVNRRDLRSGAGAGTILERVLVGRPRLAGYAEKIMGTAQVSNISVKTVSDHQGMATIAAAAIFYTALIMGPFFNALSDALDGLMDALPEGLLAIVGGADMSTPAGWYYGELYSLVVPGAIIAVTVSMGARALAGEERSQTMDVLLVNPIKRSRVVLEKALAMFGMAALLGLATFLGTAAGSLIGGLDISMGNIAAASAQAFGLGILVGAFALVGGAWSGVTRVATYTGVGVALVGWVIASFLPVNERLAEWARVSPFYYYSDNQPLTNGISWANMGVFLAVTAVLIGTAVVLFERRDIRN